MLDGHELNKDTKMTVLKKGSCFRKYFRKGLYICILLMSSVVISASLFRFYQVTPYLIVGSLLAFLLLTLNIFRERGVKRKILWRLSEKTLAIPAAIWISVFVFGLICHPISGWLNVTMPSSAIRFPLSDLQGVTVDEIGNTYCLSRFYNRLQMFDSKGQFIKGWFVDLPGGDYRIRSETEGEVSVFSKNTRTKMVYGVNGLLLSKVKFKSDEFNHLYPGKNGPLIDGLGNSYEIESPFFWIKVVRTSNKGDQSIVVKDPIGLWIVAFFFPVAWFALAKVTIFFIMRRLLKIRAN